MDLFSLRKVPMQYQLALESAILLLSLLHIIPAALATSSTTTDLILDGGPDGWQTNAWTTILDGVMGGQSSGSLSFLQSNTVMSFNGDIILDGGGFSSVRKSFSTTTDLTQYSGIVVELETTSAHDVNNIKAPLGLHLQFTDSIKRWIGYASAFAIPLTSNVGETVSVYLPLTSFDRGSWIGQVCTDCQIDFSSVIEMDIYVLFQEGPFEILVKQITAVTVEQSFPSPSITLSSTDEIKNLIDETTQSGGALYNYGYYELCITIYRSVLNTLLAANNNGGDESETAPSIVSERMRNIICQGLQRAESQIGSKTNMAWTLRYTLDALVEEMGFALPSSNGSTWRPDAVAVDGYLCSGATSGAFIAMKPTNSPSNAAKPTSSPSLVTLNSTTTPPPILKTPTPSLSLTFLPTIQPTITPSLHPSITATVGDSTPNAKDTDASDPQDMTSFSSANEIDNKIPTSSAGRSYSSRFALLVIAVMLMTTTCDAFVGNSCYQMQQLTTQGSNTPMAQPHLLSSPSNEEQEQTQSNDITTLPPPPELKRVNLPAMLAGGLFLFATSVPSSQRGLADQILQLAQDALRADALVLMELGPGLEAGNVYASSYARSKNVDQLVLQFQINGGNAWAQGIGYGIQDENGVKLISLEVANMDAVLNNQSFRLDI